MNKKRWNPTFPVSTDLVLPKAWDCQDARRNDQIIRGLYTDYQPAEDKPDRIIRELRHLGIFITPGADA